MGFFDLFKKKSSTDNNKKQVLLAMPMFNNFETFDLNKLVEHLKNEWSLEIINLNGGNGTASFQLDGELVVLGTVSHQIPWEEIQATASISYNWDTAEKDLKNHNVHVIVSIMSSNKSTLERFLLLTKLLASILATTNCIGIYHGTQGLLIPKNQYLESAQNLKMNQLPIEIWVYFGILKSENCNHGYTKGLTSFGKLEMEMVNSQRDIEEIGLFLMNATNYVIANNIQFKSGQTLGYTADQKIKITQSIGHLVQGDSIKLEI
jgi:hypothetical protein